MVFSYTTNYIEQLIELGCRTHGFEKDAYYIVWGRSWVKHSHYSVCVTLSRKTRPRNQGLAFHVVPRNKRS